MTPKEISRLAGRIFALAIPQNWAVRSQEDQEDYGIDYEIELVTKDDRATGIIFKVQQKGVTQASTIENGSKVSFSDLPVAKAHYYLTQVKIPLIIVVVDISSKQTFWVTAQGNPQLQKAYENAVATGARTLTLHLPATNTLPGTEKTLLRAVADCVHAILINDIAAASSSRLVEVAQNVSRLDDLATAVAAHHDSIRAAQIDELIRTGRAPEALQKAYAIFQSVSESTELRFGAGMDIVRAFSGMILAGMISDGHDTMLRTRYGVYHQMLQLVRPHGTAVSLRRYARFLARTVRLAAHGEQTLGLSWSAKTQERTGDAYTRMVTEMARKKTLALVVRDLRRAQLSFNRLAEHKYYRVLPDAWSELADNTSPLVLSLRVDGLKEAAAQIVQWFDLSGRIVIDAAVSLEDWRGTVICAGSLALLGEPENAEEWKARIEASRAHVCRVRDQSIRAQGLRELDELATRLPRSKDQVPSTEDEIAVHKRMAVGLGIDLDDPDDEIAEIVRLGLLDLNPERVLRKCEHLFVSLGFSGIPAQMLGLPTAGSKLLHCTLHDYTLMAYGLDSLYEYFAEEYCAKCKDCAPHDADWKWTRVWQCDQDVKWKEFAERKKTMFG